MRFALVVACALLLSACGGGKDAKLAAQGASFLAQNAKAPGVQTLPDGLQYKVVRSGPATGPKPGPNDEVKVHYEGKLQSTGKVFDSSYARGVPAAFPLQGLIPAWIEALQMMRPGDEWLLYVPATLGYGDEGAGEIPPGAVLIFRIELIGVLQADGGVGRG
jgi:peptidylprolyl isomerase/FKBP-type peptidyl-prolyl cis-trans isomerase FklB